MKFILQSTDKTMKDVIIPPIPTPFVSEQVSHEKLQYNLKMLIHAGVSGVLALGSNGESVFLSEHEKCRIIETVRDIVPADKIVIAGTGCESTKKTIELTNQVAGLGADYALIGPPHYFKSAMTTDTLSDHYTAIADSVEIPIIPYNSPGFTGLNLGPDLIGTLAEHPNIPGVKDGTGNIAQLAEFRRVGGPDFIIFTGNAPTFLAALFVGINGGMMPIANCFPEQWMKLIDLFRRNRLEEARQLETLLLNMTSVIMKFGPGGIKAAMDLLGFFGGPPMRPLKPPAPAACKDIQAALENFKKNL